MKLQVKGKDFPIDGGYLVEDLDNYYSYVEFSCPGYIESDKITLDDNVAFIVRRIYGNDSFTYHAVSEKTYKLLNSVYEEFEGETTVLRLLTRLGIPFNKKLRDSSPSFWMLPKFRLKSVIDILNKYAVFGNGAAPRFYVNLNGELSYIDYKLSYERTASNLAGRVLRDSTFTDWVMEVPGILDLYYSDVNGFHKETITLDKNYGRACQRIIDNTGNYVKQFKQRYNNLFYTNYYTSRRLEVDEVTGTFLVGDAVTVNGVHKFVLSCSKVPLPLGDSPLTMAVKLVCPRSLEQ